MSAVTKEIGGITNEVKKLTSGIIGKVTGKKSAQVKSNQSLLGMVISKVQTKKPTSIPSTKSVESVITVGPESIVRPPFQLQNINVPASGTGLFNLRK